MKSMQNLLIAAALGGFLRRCGGEHHRKPVRIAAPFEIKGSDPALSGDILLRMDVVETLVEVNERGEPVAALAQRWQVSDDGLRWQFQLRDGVHFHDGSLLDAVAVVKSLNTARGKAGLLDKTPIADISGAGQLVTITLREPFTPLLSVWRKAARKSSHWPAGMRRATSRALLAAGRLRSLPSSRRSR